MALPAKGADDLPPAPEAGEDLFIIHCRLAIAADFKRRELRFPYAARSADGSTVEVIYDRSPSPEKMELGSATCTYPAPPDLKAYEAHRFLIDGKPLEGIDRTLATKGGVSNMIAAQLVEWPDSDWVHEAKYVDEERQRRLKEALLRQQDRDEYGAARLLARSRERTAAGDKVQAVRIAELLAKLHPDAAEAKPAGELVLVEGVAAERESADLQARRTKALKDLVKRFDPVDRINWFHAPGLPVVTRTNGVVLYIGQSEKGALSWLRVRINYHGDDWLFLNSFTVVADDERFFLEVPKDSIDRDHEGGKVWEWFDDNVKNREVWAKVAAAKEASIRLGGKTYHSDRKITKREQAGIQQVLDAYHELKEKE